MQSLPSQEQRKADKKAEMKQKKQQFFPQAESESDSDSSESYTSNEQSSSSSEGSELDEKLETDSHYKGSGK